LTPEAQDFIRRAHIELEDAEKIVAIDLGRPAARAAYYAMFHAAEALIFERNGRIAKTHSGVRSEFSRLTKDSEEDIRRLARVLNDAYGFKELGDYGRGKTAEISVAMAETLITDARDFVRRLEAYPQR
jgi:uncharacterized protein (UPF0332 family)